MLFQVRCNALIKRGSLRMQNADASAAMNDFATAAREDPDNSDIYHHRGQVQHHLLHELLRYLRVHFLCISFVFR